MKITYIGHSGYFVEFSDCCCLFDYYTGGYPQLPAKKPLFIFVSHHHPDHYNPEIYKLAEQMQKIWYILPPDLNLRRAVLPLSNEQVQELLQEGKSGHFLRVKARNCYILKEEEAELEIETLRSTDCGVAYLVSCKGQVVFHAGDLNWWAQENGTKQENNNMKALYTREIDRLAGRAVHAAFLPLDPRQGACYWYGFDYFLRTIKPKYAFPMHYWEDNGIVQRFLDRGIQYESQIYKPLQPLKELEIF